VQQEREPRPQAQQQQMQQQLQQEREPRPQAQQQREPHRRTVEIEGELTIHTAAEHRGALLAVIEAEGMLALDLSAVTELDTAGLQLLLLAQREADHLGGRLQITGASRSVLDVLAIAHLDSTLGHLGGPTGAEARR
jgi:anti-anti-sigma factor